MSGSVGADLVEVDRIRRAMENPRFLREFFTEGEREYFSKKKHPEQSVAGVWAAKEAFSKALGTGFREFGLREVEVLRTPLGQPQIHLQGRAAERYSGLQITVSISHTAFQAMAVVYLSCEKKDKGEKTCTR